MNTVACYTKDIGKNVKVENLPATELDHLLCKFFMNISKKNRQEYKPGLLHLQLSVKYPKIFE